MTTNHLLFECIKNINRNKFFILVLACITGALLLLMAIFSRPVYTSRATVFPLTSQNENAIYVGGLNALLGLTEPAKSFSSEAAINILELAQSRNVRESVAAARLAKFGNKTIAELLINGCNAAKRFYSSPIPVPADSTSLVLKGAELLRPRIDAKINKNNVLEIYFSCADKDLVQPVSETFIAKISAFYINLRTQKAYADYSFVVRKIDSLDAIIGQIDNRAIRLQNSTFFTPERLEYQIPKENVQADRERLVRQRDASITTRDEALWRLQKVTPIIATLDKPEPPFAVEKRSPVVWGSIGFFVGLLLSLCWVIRHPLMSYLKYEIKKSLSVD